MLKTAQLANFVVGKTGHQIPNPSDHVSPMMPNGDIHIQTISCNFGSETLRSSDIRHIATLKQKSDDPMRKKQTRSILKNSAELSVSEYQKLDVSQIKCMLNRRKNLSKERMLNRGNDRNEKKVKFDDKLNRLEEIGMKYNDHLAAASKATREIPCIRHQQRLEKMSTRNAEKKDINSKEPHVHISTIYDLKENRPLSPRSLTKSTSTGSLQVQERRSSLTSTQNNHSNDDFVRVDFNEQMPIPTYNPRLSNYSECGTKCNDDKLVVNEAEEKLVERGIPAFCNSGRYIRPSEILNKTSRAKAPAASFETSVRPNYRLPNEQKFRRQDIDGLVRVSSDRRRIVNKTTTNTCGGATVTRQQVRPFMFTRLPQEPEPIHHVTPRENYKNYCDDGKTSQIMKWLQHVSDIQAKEGFCNLIPEND